MTKKRKKSAVNPFFIALRKSGASPEILKNIFDETNWDQFQEVLKWGYPRYKNGIIFRGLAPKSPSQLAKWMYYTLENPSEAFRWVAATSIFKSEEITKYNSFVLQTEGLGKNYSEVHSAASTLIRDTMISFTGLSTLLFSLSKSNGLDAQWRWISKSLYVPNASFVNVLLYFKGIASESGRDPEDIYSTMYTSLLARIDDSVFSEMIYNIVFCPPINLVKFAEIAQLMANQPIIDQYEHAANAVCSNQHFLHGAHDANLDLYTSCMVKTGDWRAQGIELLAGELKSDCVFLPLSDIDSSALFSELLGENIDKKLSEREFRTVLGDQFFYSQSTPTSYLASSCYYIKSAHSIEEFL